MPVEEFDDSSQSVLLRRVQSWAEVKEKSELVLSKQPIRRQQDQFSRSSKKSKREIKMKLLAIILSAISWSTLAVAASQLESLEAALPTCAVGTFRPDTSTVLLIRDCVAPMLDGSRPDVNMLVDRRDMHVR